MNRAISPAVPRVLMNRAVSALSHMPIWRAQGKFSFSFKHWMRISQKVIFPLLLLYPPPPNLNTRSRFTNFLFTAVKFGFPK